MVWLAEDGEAAAEATGSCHLYQHFLGVKTLTLMAAEDKEANAAAAAIEATGWERSYQVLLPA